MQEALSAGDPLTDLPLALEVDYFRISPTAYFVPVSVKVPGSVIALAEKKGGGETQFDFIGKVMDERKSVVGNVRDYHQGEAGRRRSRKTGPPQFPLRRRLHARHPAATA